MYNPSLLWILYPQATPENKWTLILQHAQDLSRQYDWTQLPDSGLSIPKSLEWQAYRDALRSIQDDFASPDDVVFPTEPAEE